MDRNKAFGFFFLVALVALFPGRSFSFPFDNEEPTVSTNPIGSSFYRHLAFEQGIALKDLVKFEKKGFGRAEMVTLILISKESGKPLKEYGRRRLKEKISLRDLAKEAGVDYPPLYKKARQIKNAIEAKGDEGLPAPEFEDVPATKVKKSKKEKTSPTPSPTPSQSEEQPTEPNRKRNTGVTELD